MRAEINFKNGGKKLQQSKTVPKLSNAGFLEQYSSNESGEISLNEPAIASEGTILMMNHQFKKGKCVEKLTQQTVKKDVWHDQEN